MLLAVQNGSLQRSSTLKRQPSNDGAPRTWEWTENTTVWAVLERARGDASRVRRHGLSKSYPSRTIATEVTFGLPTIYKLSGQSTRKCRHVPEKSITRQQPGRVRRAKNEPSEPHSFAAAHSGGTFVASRAAEALRCASQKSKRGIPAKFLCVRMTETQLPSLCQRRRTQLLARVGEGMSLQ